jgi:uncharacterized membrane protein YqaE (UPF0057 family)
MDADQYVKDRLQPEIDWNDRKSGINKRAHTWSKIVEIVCAAVIPFLAGYAKDGYKGISVAIGILGVVVATSAIR